jgi:hypothetical protein
MQLIKLLSTLSLYLSIMTIIVTTLRDHVIPGGQPNPAISGQIENQAANDNAPSLSAQRIRHILYGDETGGGHVYGLSLPCKSEFPPDWSDDDIIATVQALAANDNMKWKQQENGYYVAERSVKGVRVRVVLDREKDDIITAYPTNRPRNPCP